MGTILKIIGGIWALIGVWQIVKISWQLSGEQQYYLGLSTAVPVDHWTLWSSTAAVAMFIFVLPGLVVSGVGTLINRRG